MDWQSLIEKVLETLPGISWAVALVWLGYLFRREIAGNFGKLAERLDKVRLRSAEVTFREQQAPSAEPGFDSLPRRAEAGPSLQVPSNGEIEPLPPVNPPYEAAVRQAEDYFHQRIAEPQLQRFDRQALAARAFADATVALQLERHHRVIFGSQFQALQALISAAGTLDIDVFTSFYHAVVASKPGFDQRYPLHKWLSYMISSDLISIDGQTVRLNPTGMALDAYVRDNNLMPDYPL